MLHVSASSTATMLISILGATGVLSDSRSISVTKPVRAFISSSKSAKSISGNRDDTSESKVVKLGASGRVVTAIKTQSMFHVVFPM